jgi:hypothetical protein
MALYSRRNRLCPSVFDKYEWIAEANHYDCDKPVAYIQDFIEYYGKA